MSRPKSWAALAAAITVAFATSLAGPADALADRCNPDELAGPAYTLVTGQPYTPVFGQDQGPFCYVMKTVVYPAIGCGNVPLVDCLRSQPTRAITIAKGICRSTLIEVIEVYFGTAPARVQQVVTPILDFITQDVNC